MNFGFVKLFVVLLKARQKIKRNQYRRHTDTTVVPFWCVTHLKRIILLTLAIQYVTCQEHANMPTGQHYRSSRLPILIRTNYKFEMK